MSRNQLHISKLEAFKIWLDSKHIQHRPSSADWQVLQVKYGQDWLGVYTRADMQEHYTVDKRLDGTVKEFCRHQQEEKKMIGPKCSECDGSGMAWDKFGIGREPCKWCDAGQAVLAKLNAARKEQELLKQCERYHPQPTDVREPEPEREDPEATEVPHPPYVTSKKVDALVYEFNKLLRKVESLQKDMAIMQQSHLAYGRCITNLSEHWSKGGHLTDKPRAIPIVSEFCPLCGNSFTRHSLQGQLLICPK